MISPVRSLVAAPLLLLVACAGGSEPSTGGGTGGQVVLEHQGGTLTLPSTPVRIVTTSDETTELVAALGIQPVGVGSTRMSETSDEQRFAGYYLSPDVIGSPTFVGGAETDLERVVGLRPDLIVHGADDEVAEDLAAIAPTAVYDVQQPGAWQEALTALGPALGEQDAVDRVLDGYTDQVAAARAELTPVAATYPRLGVVYPEYRGGAENYLLGEEFALASVLPDLGFTLAGSPGAVNAFPGVQEISTELYPTVEADLLLALGVRPWKETASSAVLGSLDVPVVGVALDDGQPSAGPLTSPELLERYRGALAGLA